MAANVLSTLDRPRVPPGYAYAIYVPFVIFLVGAKPSFRHTAPVQTAQTTVAKSSMCVVTARRRRLYIGLAPAAAAGARLLQDSAVNAAIMRHRCMHFGDGFGTVPGGMMPQIHYTRFPVTSLI